MVNKRSVLDVDLFNHDTDLTRGLINMPLHFFFSLRDYKCTTNDAPSAAACYLVLLTISLTQ